MDIMENKIGLAHSTVNNKVRANVNACLDENRLGQGRFIKEFEDKVAEFIGVKHAIAVSSGSMADIVALATLKAQHPDKDEVIVPALTFIAQTNAVLINGLVPVFVDIGQDLQMDVNQIVGKINARTLAIFPVHLLGKKCNIESIRKIAAIYNVPVIEDCCEGFGVWGQSDMGTFSFFPSHTITTGEGGMIITNNYKHAELARKIMNHGRKGDSVLDKFHFDMLGFNGKMSNILASIGCAVIPEANSVIKKRQENVEMFNKLLSENWFAESPHGYPLFYKDSEERDSVLLKLNANGIEARKLFSCLPTVEYRLKGNYPIAESIGQRGLYVPVHQGLTKKDIERIALFL